MDKRNIQDTVTDVAIIDVVTIWGSVLITAARGESLVVSSHGESCHGRSHNGMSLGHWSGGCLGEWTCYLPSNGDNCGDIPRRDGRLVGGGCCTGSGPHHEGGPCLFITLLLNGGCDLGLDDRLVLVAEVIIFGDGLLSVVALLGLKLVVGTYPLDSSINLGGNFGFVLPVAVHDKVILVTASKTVATLDLSLGRAGQVLLVGLLSSARVGRCV